MKAQFSYVRWGRVLQTSVLVTILGFIPSFIIFSLANRVWSQPDQSQMVFQVTFWSTSILGILLTAGGAVWVGRKLGREAPLHGFLVGLVSALLLFLSGFGFSNLTLSRLMILVLTVATGWLGGVACSRWREMPSHAMVGVL